MIDLSTFADVAKHQEPLAPYTYLKVGGPAEWLVQPRSVPELAAVVQLCLQQREPLRVLGNGCNVLVHDEGVRGVVLRLTAPAFTEITVQDRRVRAGSGAAVSTLISQAARHSLGGLETDLEGRVMALNGKPLPGLYAAGEVAGFGGGGVHGYRALEGTFLGGCIFSGRTAMPGLFMSTSRQVSPLCFAALVSVRTTSRHCSAMCA